MNVSVQCLQSYFDAHDDAKDSASTLTPNTWKDAHFKNQGSHSPAPPPSPKHRGSMGFVEAVRTCFKKYFTFSGRASRAEFWWFTLFIFIVYFLLKVVGSIENLPAAWDNVELCIQLFLLCPSLAVTVRRLHDAGYSCLILVVISVLLFGIPILAVLYNKLLLFAPIYFLLELVMIVLLCFKSQPHTNKYGSVPVH
ncbi:DUF805 domain-containing protein [Brackiella oedipodis]|uniref:DUF805 domain-containing protein n=1 Tax=Brackiella oedipodis TaxID=124225 RepID=UPI000688D06E|nr:DUF805 domain-containing protein [Brackiella oedipodis]